jgi:hypothetical protein
MVADARLRKIAPDATLAGAFLDQAKTFLADGAKADNSSSSRQVLLHNAAIAACDAVLAVGGLEVQGSAGGHALRLDEAQRQLGEGLDDLFENLDLMRLTRADVSYRAGFAGPSSVDEALMTVTMLVQHAEEYLDARREM